MLDTHLTHLEGTGLVRVASLEPEIAYLFHHALVQDAAYHSLLRADRRYLHQLVGQTLEHLYADRLEEMAPQLGYHFQAAGRVKEALGYFMLAADSAFKRYALDEAILLYEQAKGLLLPESDESTLHHLYSNLGRALEMQGAYPEALALYESLEVLAQARQEAGLELAALTMQGTILAAPTSVYDRVRGEAIMGQGLAMARALGDQEAECLLLWNLLLLKRFDAPEQALRHGERAMALARSLNLRERLAYLLNDLYVIYLLLGRLEAAEQGAREAIQLWRELGNQAMLADGLSGYAEIFAFKGDYESALAVAHEAQQISDAIDNLWNRSYSRLVTGLLYLEWGEIDQALATMNDCVAYAEQAGFVPAMVLVRCQLALLYGLMGDPGKAKAVAQLAIERMEQYYRPALALAEGALALSHIWVGELEQAAALMQSAQRQLLRPYAPALLGNYILIAQAELDYVQGEYAALLTLTQQWVDYYQQVGMRLFYADLLYWQGRAHLELGERAAARHSLEAARQLAESLSQRRILWAILAALAGLAQQEGKEAMATTLRVAAREVVGYIAAHSSDPALRATFLARPEVAALLA